MNRTIYLCRNCGRPVVACPFDDHQPWSLCHGWRHATDHRDVLPLTCPGPVAASGSYLTADPIEYLGTPIPYEDRVGFTHPARLVLVVALSLIVVAAILDAIFGWTS